MGEQIELIQRLPRNADGTRNLLNLLGFPVLGDIAQGALAAAAFIIDPATGLAIPVSAANPLPVAGASDVAVHDFGTPAQHWAIDAVGRGAEKDQYTAMEALDDQIGAGGVLTFTFSAPVDTCVIFSSGAPGNLSRATTTQTPTASKGAVCDNQVPTYLVVTAAVFQVFANAGTTVSVWGYRY